jgi:hypothetical protein
MALAKVAWFGICVFMLSACGRPGSPNTPVLSSDATLSNLVTSSGSLGPDFRSAVNDYDVVVNRLVNSIAITPTTSHVAARLTVDGKRMVSGNTSSSIPLDFGNNSIALIVTAEDRNTTRTYTLTIFRMQL